MEAVQQGLERCPFLREVAEREGHRFAQHIACRPTVPFARSAGPVLREAACDFAATFQLFHGPSGVVPLRSGVLPAGAGCPFHTAKNGAQPASRSFATAAPPAAVRREASTRRPAQQLSPFAGSPMASLSLSFGLPAGLGDWWQRRPSRAQQRRQQQKQQRQPGQTTGSGGTVGGGTGASSSGKQAGGRFGSGRLRGGGRFRNSTRFRGGGRFRSGNGFSSSNFAKRLGGLAALGAGRELKCPAAIVAARAAVARLKPVRDLRPQALPVKLLAIGAFTGAANAPSGAAREHTRKFSPEWFLAVHATIPFIATLRKAVVMPKWAMAWTIACAVVGQVLGSRLERARLQQLQLSAASSGGSAAAVGSSRSAGAESGGSSAVCAPGAACGQAAVAELRHEGAWRQSFLVPAVC